MPLGSRAAGHDEGGSVKGGATGVKAAGSKGEGPDSNAEPAEAPLCSGST